MARSLATLFSLITFGMLPRAHAQVPHGKPPFFMGVDASLATSAVFDNGVGATLRFHESSPLNLQEGGVVVSYSPRPRPEDTFLAFYGGGTGGNNAEGRSFGTPLGGITAVYAPQFFQLRAWGHILGVPGVTGKIGPAANFQFSAAGTPINTERFRFDLGLDVEAKNLRFTGSAFAALELKRVQLGTVDLSARVQGKFTLICGNSSCSGALAFPLQFSIEGHREESSIPRFSE